MASNRGIQLTVRQVAAFNHAKSHDLSKVIDKCWRCRWIMRRERRRRGL